MNWLNYHHLYYFKTVVEQGSIAKASLFLKLGQPSISMQIKSLEQAIGKNLFTRSNKKLQLTETGVIVFEYAKEIFSLGSELLNTLHDQAHSHVKLQIGVQDSVPKNLITKITSYIYQNFNAMISIYNGNLEEISLSMIKHQLDIAILNHPPIIKDKTTLFNKCLLKSPVVLAGSKKFLHLKNQDIQAFKDVPFILPTSEYGLRHKIEHYFHQQNLEINLVGEATDTLIQKNMAISGNGIIAIMIDAITPYIESEKLYVLKTLNDIEEEIWMVQAKRKIQNPIATKLLKEYDFKKLNTNMESF